MAGHFCCLLHPRAPTLLPAPIPAAPAAHGPAPSMTRALPAPKVVLLALLPAELCASEFRSEWVARHAP